MSAGGVAGVDAALLARFRAAGATIAWRSATSLPGARVARARIAHLHDEEARVEEREGAVGRQTVVDSGPVGALVLLLEIDQLGTVPSVDSIDGSVDPAFPSGALVAAWGSAAGRPGAVPLADLVALARYALA